MIELIFIQKKYFILLLFFKRLDAQLVRVAAHEATSVLITMTERDKEEQDLSLNADGLPTIGNSATLRTLLALRNVM